MPAPAVWGGNGREPGSGPYICSKESQHLPVLHTYLALFHRMANSLYNHVALHGRDHI